MTVVAPSKLGNTLPKIPVSILACVLCVCTSIGAYANGFDRRLSNFSNPFSVPRQQFFFSSPTRFNQFNNGFNTGFNNLNQFGGFNNFNPFNNQFNQFNQFGLNRFNQFSGTTSFFNNRNLVDSRQATVIPNFSKIRTFNNAIIEVDQFGIGQRLFIDRNGDLIGGAKQPEARTVQQLKEFYLDNRDKFKGNQKILVDRFLQKQGALSNGLFKVDLDDFAIDLKDAKMQEILKRYGGDKVALRRDLGRKALNYLLNSLQGRFKIRIPKESVNPADGTVTLNLSPYFRGEVLALFNQADETSACTGKTRLNKLINFTMDPETYYKILNAPNNVRELSAAYGVEPDKTLTFQNKIVVGVDENGVRESLPARSTQRILEVQTARNVPGSSCYRSLDTKDQPRGGEQSRARSIKEEGINFVHDAEEWLCLGANGFMQGYLFNGQGQRIAVAPSEIATSGRLLNPQIRAVVSCLDCHADGFIGGGERFGLTEKKNYTDHFNDVKNAPTIFRDSFGRLLNHRDYFIHNKGFTDQTGRFIPQYYERAQRDSAIFRAARQQTDSEFLDGEGKPFQTLPKIEDSYWKSLTPETAAVELGFGDSPDAVKRAEGLIGKHMDRAEFDGKYCNLISGRNDFLNEIQEQQINLRERFNNGGFNNFIQNHNGRR